jgi:hypothetical protein
VPPDRKGHKVCPECRELQVQPVPLPVLVPQALKVQRAILVRLALQGHKGILGTLARKDR